MTIPRLGVSYAGTPVLKGTMTTLFRPIRKLRNEARNTKRRLARAGILAPLQPTMGPYPSELATIKFTAAQEIKVAELVAKASLRAGKEANKESARLKQLLAEGLAELRRLNFQLSHI
jgi:hypothetical protein